MTYATSEQIDEVIELGYEVDCTQRNGHTFSKGDRHIWAIREGWQTADLINQYYRNHQPYRTLAEALRRE